MKKWKVSRFFSAMRILARLLLLIFPRFQFDQLSAALTPKSFFNLFINGAIVVIETPNEHFCWKDVYKKKLDYFEKTLCSKLSVIVDSIRTCYWIIVKTDNLSEWKLKVVTILEFDYKWKITSNHGCKKNCELATSWIPNWLYFFKSLWLR